MMITSELANQKAVLRLESLHQEAQTQRLLSKAWRKRWATRLIELAERLEAPSLDGGQTARA